jgi:hypothetical protein
VGQAQRGLPAQARSAVASAAALPHAVDITAEVPGDLLQWLRTSGGEWHGLVTYPLPFANGKHGRVYLERRLLPAYGLRPRKYGRHPSVAGYGSVTRVGGVTSVPDPGPMRRGPSGPPVGVRSSTAA